MAQTANQLGVVSLPISVGATTPVPTGRDSLNPQGQGAIVFSSTLGYLVGWTGSSWQLA